MSMGGEELKVKQSLNKKKILELLQSSNSVEQHVYYQKGENPEKIQQYYLETEGPQITGGKTTKSSSIKPKIEPVKSKIAIQPQKRPNILRTIYMPNYEVDEAKKQIQILRTEIEDEKSYYQDIMKQLQDQKIKDEDDQRNRYLAMKEEYEELLQKLHQKEEYNQSIGI